MKSEPAHPARPRSHEPTHRVRPRSTAPAHRARSLSTVVALLLVVLTVPLAACGSGGDEGETASTDTLTRRQKDSLISTMPVPGAGAVGKALESSDSLAARAARHDSMLNR